MRCIVIVGPCGSGKTTLVHNLRMPGLVVRAVAQEHSIIPDLWRRAGQPDVVIYLDADRTTIARRRGRELPSWLYDEQIRRLTNAREHATLSLDTSKLTPIEVHTAVLRILAS